jgi:cell division inhibitor SepF
MSFIKSAQKWLGLGEDEDYDDYDPAPDRSSGATRPGYGESDAGTVRTIPARPTPTPAPGRPAGTNESGEVPAVVVRSRQPSAVRTVPAAQAKPYTVRPRRFDQAQEVADKFKEGQPVIVNLQDVERDLSRRLIDFSSGLCYGLGGTMDKVANGVYLLTPANVQVSAEDRRLLGERGTD